MGQRTPTARARIGDSTTIDEFIAELEKTKGWYVDKSGHIVRDGNCGLECPLTAMAARLRHEALEVGAELGMELDTIMDIIHAADCAICDDENDRKLRERLLEACGVKNKP